MWLNYTLAIFLLVIAHDASGQNQAAILNPRSSQTLDVVANSVTNLAQKISLAIANPKSKTEIFSPVSIAGALSLLLLGSGGTTKEELMKLMGFQNEQISFTDIHKSFGKLFRELVSNEPTLQVNVPWRETDKCNNVDYDEYESRIGSQSDRQRRDADSHLISVANGIFLSHDLQVSNTYSNVSGKLYRAEIRRLNFAGNPEESSSVINQWVSTATRGKIRDIVTPDQVNGIPMVLASALYFKAKWETMFIAHNTKTKPFYLNGHNQPPIDVETMGTSGCFPFYDAKEIDAKIVGIPYQEKLSTMYIVLPNDSNRQKLQDLQKKVSLQQINRMIDLMQTKTGSILMPKMKIENSIHLKTALQALGLHQVFDSAVSNLIRITHWESSNQAARRPSISTAPTIAPTFSAHRIVYTTEPSVPVPNPSIPNTNFFFKYPEEDEEECNRISNCHFDGRTCNCDLNQRPTVTGCQQKLFHVTRQCQSTSVISSVEGTHKCVLDAYTKIQSDNRNQCIQQKCIYASHQCFCCKGANVQPVQQIPQQPQQPQPTQPGFAVSNRFNPGENTRDEISQCLKTYCDPHQVCKTYIICPLTNTQKNPAVGTGRAKRQAKQLYVDQIAHKVSLDINEQGTEGGAVTAVIIDRITSSFTLRIEAPFLLYLRNDITKLPLFYGPVFDPRP
ncbi:serine protease inhibitor 28Dc-like isoform X1 [Toxorhynchites rutilus septentrionalis]|uniref:serine protease inhibitor 28Dc-like isoform X1 n=1 Tax=Toxorhynchites rutilus septentrionalis TaxID=329112 RepID=UPI00247B1CDD|nr:serine protease inhibitor 28Dc-like isoform X1 [Toxorhynchites rutilus septentrionalis]XP_055641861.1 serine protease inhibitor 28Dc-like isoform X1 [Toxorhynchites rutilus septentrionalis]XP_055641862.1 serine protease inhibitor 28Dc-like isoform X1 [Toxorhynchites rutilus septentrionalis]XP_055641863.1 serine protease inhibitor 28Dc-like isoform X1 [Toxorhynchites rutilus septentrionalis]XP_055641864.1 serine protease inhibitor 28Dc-like isoform X1 [Toxorhynchites rutilus septentrionalis]